MPRLGAFLLIAVCAPVFALAQSEQSDLGAAIRADLQQDPRAAEMSEAELDALVAALAAEAEASGAAETYLEAKSAPVFTYEAPPVSGENPYLLVLSSPIVIAILAFVAALLGVVLFMIRLRRTRRNAPPAAA